MNTILTDVIPAKYRRLVYALVALAAFLYSLWQASQGDWGEFIGSILVSLTTSTAASNTKPSEPLPVTVVEAEPKPAEPPPHVFPDGCVRIHNTTSNPSCVYRKEPGWSEHLTRPKPPPEKY